MEPVQTMQTLPCLVQIEEAKCVIRKLSFVTDLAPVRTVGDKGRGCQDLLSCYGCQEYVSCPKKQEPVVRLSREHRTDLTCLQEKNDCRIVMFECAQAVAKKAAADAQTTSAVSPDTPNVIQTMMQLDQAKTRAKVLNKVALETEKEKVTAEKTVEELKGQLQPKSKQARAKP